jgi:hypothetical protein
MEKNKIIIKIICSLQVLMFLLTSCENNDNMSSTKYFSNVPDLGQPATKQITNLTLTRVKVDTTLETSYVGYFWCNRDTLYFSDAYYQYIYSLRTDGSYIKRHVGRGKGPNEVIAFEYSVPFNNGYCLYTTSNIYMEFFNTSWQKKSATPVNWGGEDYRQTRKKNPDPQQEIFYQDDGPYIDVVQQWDSAYIAMAVTSGLELFNGFQSTELYYNYSRIIALVNPVSGTVDKVFGRRSPVFMAKQNIPNMDHFTFVPLKDTVFVTFRPDSFIYLLDKMNDKAIGKFGRQGRNMNTAYFQTYTFEDGFERWHEDYDKYGYYTYLKYDAKRKIWFRGYTQGSHSQFDGLQIYEDYALIADLDVPKGFSIVRYCGDQLIASIEDEEIKELALHFYIVDLIPKTDNK